LPSLLDRYYAITLCIEQAVKENRTAEIAPLVEARGEIVKELAALHQEVPEERWAAFQEAEERLMAALRGRRNATLERLTKLRASKSLRSTYSNSF
jgi:hypothetical protein